MAKPLIVHLFAEDRAHEEFLRALLTRLARQEKREIELRVYAARGGHGRALAELAAYQSIYLKGASQEPLPDLVFVAIDANCQRFAQARQAVAAVLKPPFEDRAVIACPDPHIECWYLADPESFAQVVGRQPQPSRKKCERDRYKSILDKAIRDAGHPPTLGGIEFARELVEAMDFFRAGKADSSLKHFLDESVKRLRQA